MTGLNKILGQIQREADDSAAAIMAKSEAEAAGILNAAQLQGKSESDAIGQNAKNESADIAARAESAAALLKRKAVLKAKQEIINEIIIKAKASLYKLPDAEYFGIIVKMAKRFALAQAGEILFSPTDFNRLPNGFEKTLNTAVKANGATLKLVKETRPIDGGFVLIYGGVEENCSFEALFNSAHDTLQDKVHGLLFS
ncbi:MAG: V-type ATP synthase subunit E family protein [Hydrogenoanaerobacterium sp.]